MAWEKLRRLCAKADTEVGGFGITEPGEPLRVVDFVLVKQVATTGNINFLDDGIAEFYHQQRELGRGINEFGRIWIHTHPGSSAEPSHTDRKYFREHFAHLDWSVMLILAKGWSGNHGHFAELCVRACDMTKDVLGVRPLWLSKKLEIKVDHDLIPSDNVTENVTVTYPIGDWLKELEEKVQKPRPAEVAVVGKHSRWGAYGLAGDDGDDGDADIATEIGVVVSGETDEARRTRIARKIADKCEKAQLWATELKDAVIVGRGTDCLAFIPGGKNHYTDEQYPARWVKKDEWRHQMARQQAACGMATVLVSHFNYVPRRAPNQPIFPQGVRGVPVEPAKPLMDEDMRLGPPPGVFDIDSGVVDWDEVADRYELSSEQCLLLIDMVGNDAQLEADELWELEFAYRKKFPGDADIEPPDEVMKNTSGPAIDVTAVAERYGLDQKSFNRFLALSERGRVDAVWLLESKLRRMLNELDNEGRDETAQQGEE